MYRFMTGQYAGKSLEEVLLREARVWSWLDSWTEDKPKLKPLRDEFDRLREKLLQAPLSVRCRQCRTTAKWMTLPIDNKGEYLALPYFWCDEHEPWEKLSGISEKRPIHFDILKPLRNKRSQKAIHRCIREALGIKKRTRISEQYAREFFENLP